MKNKIIPAEILSALNYEPSTGVFTWIVNNSNTPIGTIAGGSDKGPGYRKIVFNKIKYLEHRLAWFFVYKEQPDVINHKNGIRDDNRIDNLENGTFSYNMHSTKKHSEGIPAGVCYNNTTKKWAAYMLPSETKANKKHLGWFETLEAAIACRNINRVIFYK